MLRRSFLMLLLFGGLAPVRAHLLGTGEASPPVSPAATPSEVPFALARDALPRDWPDQLTVFALKAPDPIDWSSPGKLMKSALFNELTPARTPVKRTLGHMFVRLQGRGRDELVGMTTAAGSESRQLVLDRGYGLGILTADQLGRLEDPAGLKAEVAAKTALAGELAYLRVLLSAPLAKRLFQYLDEYRAGGYGEHYGGGNRPRYREGGGCAPFAYSFLEVAGLTDDEYEQWRVDVRLPADLLGGPGRFVAPLAVADRGRWAAPGEAGLDWSSVEPHRVLAWIEAKYREQLDAPRGPWRAELDSYARGVGLDARAKPAPKEPIWLVDPPGTPHPLGRQDGLVPRGSGTGPRP